VADVQEKLDAWRENYNGGKDTHDSAAGVKLKVSFLHRALQPRFIERLLNRGCDPDLRRRQSR